MDPLTPWPRVLAPIQGQTIHMVRNLTVCSVPGLCWCRIWGPLYTPQAPLHPPGPSLCPCSWASREPLAVSRESAGGVGALSTVPTAQTGHPLAPAPHSFLVLPFSGAPREAEGWVCRADIFLRVLLKLRVPWVPSLLSCTTLLAIEVGPGQALVGVAVGAERESVEDMSECGFVQSFWGSSTCCAEPGSVS